MGVKGLLQLFKSIMQPTHLSQFKNKRIGIDMYSWLYRGTATCAKDLALGKAPKGHLHYCIRFLQKLKDFGIIPICVFDGDILPLKQYEEQNRDIRRIQCLDDAVKCEYMGDKKQAQKLYHQAVKIVPDDVYELIQMIKSEYKDDPIECVISPYQVC